MARFNCEKVEALPSMTLRASYQTALAFRSRFVFTRFALEFDDSLPHNLLQASSDLYEDLRKMVTEEDDSRHTIVVV